MEIYKFFNDGPGDPRAYQAADFADYFGSVLSTGFLHTDSVPGMAVSVVAGTLNTKVSAGKAIMRGHLYENTAELTLTHSIPEPTLDRIDRVVLRLDLRNSERNIKLRVKEGVAASTPDAPTLQRDNFIYEISLARVLVRKNTVQLLASDLVDERLNEAVGGLVHSLISIPTAQFQAQWDAFMAGIEDSGFATVGSVQAVDTKVETHKAEDAIDAHNASNISVADANNRFAGTNVETVLNELFQFASDGKTAVASAVTAKGVPASPSDTFPTLATKIGQINSASISRVQRGTGTIAYTVSVILVNIASVDLTKSIIKINHLGNGTMAVSNTLMRARFVSNTQIEITRVHAGGDVDFSWQVIEFNNVKSLQRGDASVTNINVNISSVNLSKSILFFSASTSFTGTSTDGYFIDGRLVSSTVINFKVLVGTANVHWQVIEFN